MTSSKVKNLVKPALLTLCAVAFSLSAFYSTSAKNRTKTASNTATTVRDAGATAVNAREARRLLRTISRKAKLSPKLAKAMMTACGYNVAPQGSDVFGSGFRSCMQSWGVSYTSLVACGAICAVAASGNPIGVAVCAACLGTAEWIVMGCLLKSVWSAIELTEDPTIARSHTRGTRQTKLWSKRALATSLWSKRALATS